MALITVSTLFFKHLVFSSPVIYSSKPTPIVTEVSAVDTVKGKPTFITIPALQINSGVENGVYNSANHTWNLSFAYVHHAEMSAPANMRGGNTFIYGHNTEKLFGRLPNLKTGDEAIVETADGLKFHYQFQSVSVVQPDDVSALDYSGLPILTLQTCSGNWNEKRQMFRFTLQHVEIPNGFRS